MSLLCLLTHDAATDWRRRALQEVACPDGTYDKSFGNINVGLACGFGCVGGPKTNKCCECACVTRIVYEEYVIKHGQTGKDMCEIDAANKSASTTPPTTTRPTFTVSSSTSTFPTFIERTTSTIDYWYRTTTTLARISGTGNQGQGSISEMDAVGLTPKSRNIIFACLGAFCFCSCCCLGCCVCFFRERLTSSVGDSLKMSPGILQINDPPTYFDSAPQGPPGLDLEPMDIPQQPEVTSPSSSQPGTEAPRSPPMSPASISSRTQARKLNTSMSHQLSIQSRNSLQLHATSTFSDVSTFSSEPSPHGGLPRSSSRPPSHRWRVNNYIDVEDVE